MSKPSSVKCHVENKRNMKSTFRRLSHDAGHGTDGAKPKAYTQTKCEQQLYGMPLISLYGHELNIELKAHLN